MKKFNVFLVFVAVLVLLGGFTACKLDTATRVTVSFDDPDGGNVIAPVTIEKGEALGVYFPTELVHQTDEEKAFKGWFAGATEYYYYTPIGDNVTLKAVYTKDYEYVTVSFSYTQTDSSGDIIEPTYYEPPKKVFKGRPIGWKGIPAVPRSKGWKFDGWTLDGEDFDESTFVYDDITIEANWVPKGTYRVQFVSGPGGAAVPDIIVYEDECIDEWEVRFPPKFTGNTSNPSAFFVAWLDKENREYDGRTPIRKDHILYDPEPDPQNPKSDPITAKWGLPPKIINFQTEVLSVTTSPSDGYGDVDYSPKVKTSWDGKTVIVNETTYDVPYNTNRWRILYRIALKLPDDFNIGFYTRYTVRARFYANRQGAATWPNEPEYEEGKFTPNNPATTYGYKEGGLLHGINPESRSDDGWGQVSWTSVPNWDGQGANEETMLQRYNLDRKGGTINDTWAPLRSKDLKYPPYLLIQTSDAYIGHIEVTEIVFHNGEKKYTMYVDEEGYDEADDGYNH